MKRDLGLHPRTPMQPRVMHYQFCLPDGVGSDVGSGVGDDILIVGVTTVNEVLLASVMYGSDTLVEISTAEEELAADVV